MSGVLVIAAIPVADPFVYVATRSPQLFYELCPVFQVVESYRVIATQCSVAGTSIVSPDI